MFSQSVRAGLRTASRASVRAMSTAPVRTAPKVAAMAAGAALSGMVAYKGKSRFVYGLRWEAFRVASDRGRRCAYPKTAAER